MLYEARDTASQSIHDFINSLIDKNISAHWKNVISVFSNCYQSVVI